jgi:D-psicose/D-tagatose/L-ribulose 3-epimerase
MAGNRIGIHAGVWGFDWSPAAAERAITGAATAGFDLVEIPAIDRDELDASDTKRLLVRHGMDSVVSLALGFDDDINTTDAACSARGEHRLEEAVAFATDIGAPFVGGVIYSAMGRYTRPGTAAERDNALAVLGRIAARAARDGITLGIEYVNRYESNLLNTAAQAVSFIEDLGADNVVLHLDTFHAHVEEVDVTAPFAVAGDRLGYIHASESHRGRLGTGAIDWPRLMRTLIGSGYAGAITVETFSSAVLAPGQAADIGLWRSLWTDPTAIAADSNSFLRSQLAAASATVALAA